MSRHSDDNQRWILIEPAVLARVEGTDVTGLLIYGDISAERLRAVRLSRLDHMSGMPPASNRSGDGGIPTTSRFPEWTGPCPPSADEVRAAEPALNQAKVGRLVPTGNRRAPLNTRVPLKTVKLVVDGTTRHKGEPARDFYDRFSQMFQEISLITPSPNQVIADTSGLPSNTIKQYVHRARALGFLPPSRRRRK